MDLSILRIQNGQQTVKMVKTPKLCENDVCIRIEHMHRNGGFLEYEFKFDKNYKQWTSFYDSFHRS